MDPTQIGPYRITGRLGEGAMGVVYRGVPAGGGGAVAIKTARAGEATAANLRSELRALARVRDPRVVQVLDFGNTDAGPYFAMEFIEGRTWQAFNQALWAGTNDRGGAISNPTMSFDDLAEPTVDLPNDEPPPLDAHRIPTLPMVHTRPKAANGHLGEVITLVRKLCPPLAQLHAVGLVHRDLKPANVIIRPDGTPVIMDFGVVSRFRGAVGRERLEVTGNLVGTLAYMSPEQARGQRVDARADLYSLGCMLYESVTGRLPLTGGTISTILSRVMSDTPAPPSTIVDGVPVELEELILRLLAKDARSRIGFAEDVARTLDHLGADDPDGALTGRAYLFRPEMVGREEPLRLLDGAVSALGAGKGAFILIAGESGVGKTFLASEAARTARVRRLGVVTGECLPMVSTDATLFEPTGAPLHPLRPLLVAIADKCRTSADAYRRILADNAPILAPYESALEELRDRNAWTEPLALSGELARQRALRAMRDVLGAWVNEQGPQLLILDDLQWADELTLALLRSLGGDWLAARGLLIVATLRTDEAHGEIKALAGESWVRRIDLGRLDPARIRALVGDMLAMTTPPGAFIDAVAGWSEGNPFFVAEYLRMAAAEGFLSRRGGRWELGEQGVATLPAPNSVRDLVRRRLAGLPRPLQEAVDAACVLGREFALPVLAAVLEQDGEALRDRLRDLETRQVLEATNDDGWRFAHDKIREALYERLPADARRELHRRAAYALDALGSGVEAAAPRVLANHWKEAGEWVRAQSCLERAGEQALRNYSNEEAIRCFEEVKGLQERIPTPPGELRAARWDRYIGEAWLDLGDQPRGQASIGTALTRLGLPPLPEGGPGLLFALLGQVMVRIAQSNLPSLFDEKRPDRRLVLVDAAHLYNRLLEPKMLNNEIVLGLYCGLRNINLAERTTPSPAMARGFGMMSAIVVNTPFKGVALRWADRALAVAEQLRAQETLSYALHRSAVPYFALGRWDEALARFTRSSTIAERDGDRRRLDEARAGLAIAHCARGRWADCVATASECLQSSVTRGDLQTAAWSQALLIEAYARLGQARESEAQRIAASDTSRLGDGERTWLAISSAIGCLLARDEAGARAAADTALDITARATPVGYFIGAPLGSLAEVYLRLAESALRDGRGDAAELTARATRAIKLLDAFKLQAPFATPYALVTRGTWHAQRGNLAKARSAWAKARIEAERLEMWQVLGKAHYEEGRNAPPGQRRTSLEEAIRVWEQAGALRDRAAALEALATDG